MMNEFQGKYFIVSEPNYDDDEEYWLARTTITWTDQDGFHHRQFENLKRTLPLKRTLCFTRSLWRGPGLKGSFNKHLKAPALLTRLLFSSSRINPRKKTACQPQSAGS
jgi:hypothetical protein